MLNKSDLLLFFQEFWKRLADKSNPKFLRVVGTISIVMSAIGFIPDALKFLDITLPAIWMLYVGKAMIVAGAWGKIISMLTVTKPNSTVLPFTEKKQIQEEIKNLNKIEPK